MTAILILGLIILAWSVAFVIRAFAAPRAVGEGSVHRISTYGFTGTETADTEPGERWVDRLATNVGKSLSRQFEFLSEEQLRARLVSAGMYSTSPARMIGYQLILAVGLLCIWIWLGALAGYGPFALALGAAAAVAIGWLMPSGYIWSKARDRRKQIERELPEMIDLLVVTVEAGVSLAGGLRIAARELTGAIGEELRLTLQEQNLGLSARDALENLATRTNTAGLRIFVRGIVQGDTLGMSIGQVMRNLALEMRKRRKAAAEEKAQKAPIKMIFPLIFLIFPAMFVVLLVPALLNIANYFK